MKRYPKYKDSGVPWLGQIPAHWQVKALKFLLSLNQGGAWGEDPLGKGDTIVLRSTEQTKTGDWIIEDPAVRSLSESERKKTQLKKGDILVTKASGSEDHIGKASLVDDRVASLNAGYSNFMQRLRARPGVEPRLILFMLNSKAVREQFVYLSNSTSGLGNISSSILNNVLIAEPLAEEQLKIIDYISDECRKIDTLIVAEEKLIDLLKERRSAIITQAVTKGLNPNANMKDSGVPWLGQIPAHWEVRPLKHISAVDSCGCYGEEVSDSGTTLPVATTAQIDSNGRFSVEDMPQRNFTASEISRFKCNPGDILVVKSSGSASNIISGKAGIVDEFTPDFVFSNFLMRIRPKVDIALPSFVFALLRSHLTRQRVELMCSTTTFPNLKINEYMSALLPLPPLKEQDAISVYLSTAIKKLDSVIEAQEWMIELLKERRSAIITQAVTGQIDVR